MKMTSNKKTFLIIALFGAVISVASYFVFNEVKKKAEHVFVLEQELQFEDRQEQYLASMAKTIRESESDIALSDGSIIESDGHIEFIESIESLARQNGLSIVIESLLFEEHPLLATSSMTSFKVSAKANGSWKGTYKFLIQLESLPIKIQINKFSMIHGISDGLENNVKEISTEGNVWQSNFEIHALEYK